MLFYFREQLSVAEKSGGRIKCRMPDYDLHRWRVDGRQGLCESCRDRIGLRNWVRPGEYEAGVSSIYLTILFEFYKLNKLKLIRKPMTFAVNSAGRAVFGLPGNPVSAFVTFHLFVLPALRLICNYPINKVVLPILTFEVICRKKSKKVRQIITNQSACHSISC